MKDMESQAEFLHGRDEAAAKEYLASIGISAAEVQANSPILIPSMYVIAANIEYQKREKADGITQR
jgi:hypothetical protein